MSTYECPICGSAFAGWRRVTCSKRCAYQWRESHRKPASERTNHGTHHHRIYGLTCEAFDALLARSGGRCEICLDESHLMIDHDHQTEAIRGLVCRRCNAKLRYIDNGFRAPSEAQAAYLSMVAGANPCSP